MADPDLYLHEVVDIVGQGAVPYMEHTLRFDADDTTDRGLELLGTWYVMGTTGRWPQVVNLWQFIDGWDGWERLCRATNLKREANVKLSSWWDEAYKYRTGGFDRLLAGAPGCPTIDELRATRVTGTVFVHELTTVTAGGQAAYLDAVVEDRRPAMAAAGHTLVGAYEVLLGNTEVCTVWATTLEEHVALQRAGDPWRARAHELSTRFREELMIPCPGTLMGPSEWAS